MSVFLAALIIGVLVSTGGLKPKAKNTVEPNQTVQVQEEVKKVEEVIKPEPVILITYESNSSW